jgi:sulfur-carrier protein
MWHTVGFDLGPRCLITRGRLAVQRGPSEGLAMPIVRFTAGIQRHVACPVRDVAGTTLREVLEAYFRTNEQARGYVLDDRGQLRQHMAVFIDSRQIQDRQQLSDAVSAGSVVDVVQALSGG